MSTILPAPSWATQSEHIGPGCVEHSRSVKVVKLNGGREVEFVAELVACDTTGADGRVTRDVVPLVLVEGLTLSLKQADDLAAALSQLVTAARS